MQIFLHHHHSALLFHVFRMVFLSFVCLTCIQPICQASCCLLNKHLTAFNHTKIFFQLQNQPEFSLIIYLHSLFTDLHLASHITAHKKKIQPQSQCELCHIIYLNSLNVPTVICLLTIMLHLPTCPNNVFNSLLIIFYLFDKHLQSCIGVVFILLLTNTYSVLLLTCVLT